MLSSEGSNCGWPLKGSSLDKYRCSPKGNHAKSNIDSISKISSHPFTSQHLFGIAGPWVDIEPLFSELEIPTCCQFVWESAPLLLAMCMTRVYYIGPSLNEICPSIMVVSKWLDLWQMLNPNFIVFCRLPPEVRKERIFSHAITMIKEHFNSKLLLFFGSNPNCEKFVEQFQ